MSRDDYLGDPDEKMPCGHSTREHAEMKLNEFRDSIMGDLNRFGIDPEQMVFIELDVNTVFSREEFANDVLEQVVKHLETLVSEYYNGDNTENARVRHITAIAKWLNRELKQHMGVSLEEHRRDLHRACGNIFRRHWRSIL